MIQNTKKLSVPQKSNTTLATKYCIEKYTISKVLAINLLTSKLTHLIRIKSINLLAMHACCGYE
jgi:hypothetical protein